MNKDKVLYTLLSFKTFLAFLLSYNLITKGDGGALANALGNFIIGGNAFIGLFIFAIITIVHIIIVIAGFCGLEKGLPRRLILQSTMLDLILLLVTFYFGMQLWIVNYMMPFEDALSKMAVHFCGFGLLLYFINFAITLPYCIISARKG